MARGRTMEKKYTTLEECNKILKGAIRQVTGKEPTTDFQFSDEEAIQQVTQTIVEIHGKEPEIHCGDSFHCAAAAVFMVFN